MILSEKKFSFVVVVENVVTVYLQAIGKSVASLAKDLGTSQQNLHKKLNKTHLTTDLLQQCSIALKHDFFLDLSDRLRDERPGEFAEEKIDYKAVMQKLVKDAIDDL